MCTAKAATIHNSMQTRSVLVHRLLFASYLAVVSFLLLTLRAYAAPPTLWLIGDSTVKNGTAGLRGWGEEIGVFFDSSKITIQNRALGGRSSRTFLSEGLWDKVASQIKPADFVLMQFGHNDGGTVSGELSPGRPARGSIKGNGEESQEAEIGTTGKKETVHSYGWYLRKFIRDAKAKGATAIVLSMVPRDDWKDGKVLRVANDYGKWAAEAAKSENAPFVNLNEIVARRYEELGQEKVKNLFPKEHTHTSVEGAQFNARCVIEGLQGLMNVPLRDFVLPGSPAASSIPPVETKH